MESVKSWNIYLVFKLPAPYLMAYFRSIVLPWSSLVLFASLRSFQKKIANVLDVFLEIVL